MPAKWFKVETDFVDHPKVDSLARLIGNNQAGWYVMRLWAWVSRFCPTGHVPGHLKVSLEDSLRWSGDNGSLLESMCSVELVDALENGDLLIHDWAEYQGKVHENAEKSRVRKQEYRCKLSRNLSRGTSSGTIVGQIPTGRDGTGRDGTGRDVEKPMSTKTVDPSVVEVFNHWVLVMKMRQGTIISDKRRKRIESRLKDGYDVTTLKAAIDGCSKIPHNMGHNEQRRKYNDIELICRSPENVDSYLSANDAPATPKEKPLTLRLS